MRQSRDLAAPIELFVDEWHKIPSPAIVAMLAEGRKFGVRLRLASQHFGQLTSPQRESVIANTGFLATFRTNSSDASMLDPRFPTVARDRLERLPRHTLAYTTGDSDSVIATPDGPRLDRLAFHRFASRELVQTAENPRTAAPDPTPHTSLS